jgi:hypothetical protein
MNILMEMACSSTGSGGEGCPALDQSCQHFVGAFQLHLFQNHNIQLGANPTPLRLRPSRGFVL